MASPIDTMKAHTEYLWFRTEKLHEFINITDKVEKIVADSGIKDGIALVSAMHITAAVYVNPRHRGLAQGDSANRQRLPPSSDRRNQRLRPSVEPHHRPSGHSSDYGWKAGFRPLAADLLRRV
jgi:hypothetical protein